VPTLEVTHSAVLRSKAPIWSPKRNFATAPAGATQNINDALCQVSTTANETRREAEEALEEIQALTEQTRLLKTTALDFLNSVRAA
jgi:hypothetical protein